MAEATVVEPLPKVEEIVFDGKLVGSLADVKTKISQIPFYSVWLTEGEFYAVRVESRNISRKPYLFYMIKVKKDAISMLYSIPQDTSDRLRRAFVMKELLAVLSIISEMYKVDETKFFQYVDSVIDSMLGSMTETYSSLFNKYDSLLNEYREVKKLDLDYANANRNLTIQTSQLNEDNKNLREELTALQKYSDESLIALVTDWIEVHSGTIDVDEFGKTYGLNAPRIEQILNKMVALGYIEVKE
jgi:hypothetical protein